jgi:hypothetical protein
MAQDTEHEQALQERADALVAEQQLLQKRLLQLQQELDSEADAVQQLAAGEDDHHRLVVQSNGQPSNCVLHAIRSSGSSSPAHLCCQCVRDVDES